MPGAFGFDKPSGLARDGGAAVQRLAQRIDHPAEQLLADRHRQQLARRLNVRTFLDLRVIAVDDRPDGVFFEVEHLAQHAILELKHLAGHRLAQAVDAGDAVAHLDDTPDRGDVELALVVADFLFQNACDFADIKFHTRSLCSV